MENNFPYPNKRKSLNTNHTLKYLITEMKDEKNCKFVKKEKKNSRDRVKCDWSILDVEYLNSGNALKL